MKLVILISLLTVCSNLLAVQCFTEKPQNGWRTTYNTIENAGQYEVWIERTLYFHGKYELDNRLVLREDVDMVIDEFSKKVLSIKGERFRMRPSWDGYYLVQVDKKSKLVKCAYHE